MRIALLLAQKLGATGSGTFTINLAEGLLINGHEIKIFAYGISEDCDLSPKIEVVDLSEIGNGLGYPVPGMSDIMPYPSSIFSRLTDDETTNYIEFWNGILHQIRNEDFDVVHVNHLWIVASLARNILNEKLVVSVHGTDLEQVEKCPSLSTNLHLFKPFECGVHFVSSGAQKRSAKLGLSTPSSLVFPPPFREDIFNNPAPVAEKRVGSIFVGKLTDRKGLDELLWAHAQIKQLRNSDILEIVGHAQGQLETWKRKVSELEISASVEFSGFLRPSELAKAFQSREVFVFPSWQEGFGLVAVEAANCGLKIVMPELDAADTYLKSYCPPEQLFLFSPLLSESREDRSRFASSLLSSWQKAILAPRNDGYSGDLSLALGRPAFAKFLENSLYLEALN